MPKIKGPIKMKGGFNARKFLQDNLGDAKVRIPFEATGWKSAKNSDLVTGKKIAKKAEVKKEEVVEEVKKEVKEVKPKKKKLFSRKKK